MNTKNHVTAAIIILAIGGCSKPPDMSGIEARLAAAEEVLKRQGSVIESLAEAMETQQSVGTARTKVIQEITDELAIINEQTDLGQETFVEHERRLGAVQDFAEVVRDNYVELAESHNALLEETKKALQKIEARFRQLER